MAKLIVTSHICFAKSACMGFQRLGHEDVDSMHVAQKKGPGNNSCESSNEPSGYINKWEFFTS